MLFRETESVAHSRTYVQAYIYIYNITEVNTQQNTNNSLSSQEKQDSYHYHHHHHHHALLTVKRQSTN